MDLHSVANCPLAFNNNLRTRSLLSFIAVVLQIPAGWALQFVLDYPGWGRRKRGLVGLTGVCVPLVIAWVWEMVSSDTIQYVNNSVTSN